MTGRNPDGIEDLPSPRLLRRRLRPEAANAIIGAYEAFLDPVCGTDDLSFHLVVELPATETPSARRHPPTPNWMIWWFPLHGRSTTDPRRVSDREPLDWITLLTPSYVGVSTADG
jgi:hypothetical protein